MLDRTTEEAFVDHGFEKLGAFYLGDELDPASGERSGMLLLDARDLTTHGVIIGMTGSGKTGLGVGLIEEAAIDRIPVIAIDPKGDLPNLLLTFPELAPADFRPWVNEDVARQRGVDPDTYAAQQAEAWRTGLAGWGQDGERIRGCVSTPTSRSTRPAAPPASPSPCCDRSTRRRRRSSTTPTPSASASRAR
jgi:hypothetical protein